MTIEDNTALGPSSETSSKCEVMDMHLPDEKAREEQDIGRRAKERGILPRGPGACPFRRERLLEVQGGGGAARGESIEAAIEEHEAKGRFDVAEERCRGLAKTLARETGQNPPGG